MMPASGRLYLLIAVTIFGAANAVTRRLTELGAQNPIAERNPISFCNVLFVGNLCAFLLLALLYYQQWRPTLLRDIAWKQWLTMGAVAIFGAAVTPALIFTALSVTSTNNVILISQLDTPLSLALSVLILKERTNIWVIVGAAVSLVGVALTVLLQPPDGSTISMMDLEIGLGEALVVLAAIFKAISNLISKVSLKAIPLGIFSSFRTLVGTIAFFIAAIVLYGPEHFADAASPFLWRWMLVYSAVIVVGGQLLWFSGLKRSSASEVSLVAAFNPLAGVLAAFLILGEAPTAAQYLGGGVIIGGIILNQIGVARLQAATAEPAKPSAPEMETTVSFKGI